MKFQPGHKKIALAQSQPTPSLDEAQPAALPTRSAFNLQNFRQKSRTAFSGPTFFAFLASLLLAAIYGRVAVFNFGSGVVGGDLDGYETCGMTVGFVSPFSSCTATRLFSPTISTTRPASACAFTP